MRYAFIDAHRGQHSIRVLCKMLNVHPSGFYGWNKNPLSNRAVEDARQTVLIKDAWKDSGKIYVYRKLHDDLLEMGERISANRVARLTAFYDQVLTAGITPLTVGGDHLTTLPVLRALARQRPVGMIHFDSHTDLFKDYFGGTQYTHGTPFRRAVEEGLLDPARVVQIGIRGTQYDSEDRDFARAVGIRVIPIEEFHDRGVRDVMAEAREIAGTGPTYVSYDIDFVDPAFAPGTGTPEVGGPNSFQALQVVRELAGVQIIGADLVEVSPPFDPSGGTAYLAASILFELLCQMAPQAGGAA